MKHLLQISLELEKRYLDDENVKISVNELIVLENLLHPSWIRP